MNKRIIELAEQARLPACHASHPVALNRFAELVRQDKRDRLHEILIKYNKLLFAVHKKFPNESRH